MSRDGNWLVDWWKVLALILFIGGMLVLGKVLWFLMHDLGWWWLTAGVPIAMVIAWFIDRRAARRRGPPGRSIEPEQ